MVAVDGVCSGASYLRTYDWLDIRVSSQIASPQRTGAKVTFYVVKSPTQFSITFIVQS